LGQVTGLVHEVRVDFPATGKSVVLNDVEPNMVVDVEEPE
jgi:hypothetical protein